MSTKQPDALRLADALDYYDKYDMSVTGTGIDMQAAALLRTQHAAIERKDALLRQALEAMAHGCPPDCKDGSTDSGGTYPWGEAVLMRCPTCETFESLKKELPQ